MVLRLIAAHDDIDARPERILVDAGAKQCVGRAALHHPFLTRFIRRRRNVYVHPGVRVDPLNLGDFAFEQHRRVGIELGRKRVMRLSRGSSYEQGSDGGGATRRAIRHRFTPASWDYFSSARAPERTLPSA